MGDLNDIKNKIEGAVEEAAGEVNQLRGKGVKGGIQRVKGKIKQGAADVSMKVKRAGAKGDVDWDRQEGV